MPYDRLGERLRADGSPTLATLPDGSVDRYATLSAGGVGRLRTIDDFLTELDERERATFDVDIESTEPGGQAVNAAGQLQALGAAVTCYGHLDHDVFDDLPFPTVSIGEPAVVDAINFRDGDVMFVEETGMEEWTLATLEAVADLDGAFAVDAVCCANWVSFPGLGPAFHELGAASLPRFPFTLDPGDVVGADRAEIERLCDALGALQNTFDVVYNANRAEIRATADPFVDGSATDGARVAAIREAAGIEAVVLHGRQEAIAATPDGTVAVDNLAVEMPVRHTGGGDHFAGGLGYALALDWDWRLALALGNACASHYVETGKTGAADTIASHVRETRST